MAYAVEVTLSTGNKVSLNYQSQEVSVSITYQLERDDHDVLAIVGEKAGELVAAHDLAWRRVKGEESPSVEKGEEDVELGERELSETEAASDENPVCKSQTTATSAQAGLIRALLCQSGREEAQLQTLLQAAYGCSAAEDLSSEQATSLLLEMGQGERERFNRERARTRLSDAQSASSICSPANSGPQDAD